MTIFGLALLVLVIVALVSIIRIEKKMDNILNLMQGKPINYVEKKDKKEKD